jgi:integrase
LVVQPSGTKSYCYQYRTPEGRTRRITIGRHGTYTAEQARDKAKTYQRAVDKERDPLAEKQGRREAITVSELLDLYLGSVKFAEKVKTTQVSDRGRIERHLKPLLGRKVADTLTAEEIRRAFTAIKDGKTAKQVKTGPRGLARVTGGDGAARMSIRLLKTIYSWAVDEGMVKVNPATGVNVGKDGQRNLVLAADDYPVLFKAIDELEDLHQVRRAAADAVRVIALTGARRGEVAGLRWRHVDLKKGLAELPEHKTGKKTGEVRVIGLPAAAQAIIARQPDGAPDDFVFPPAKGKGPLSLSKPWRIIREAAGLDPQIGLHGLRHSLATIMAISGAQAAQIMAVMGHRDISTSQRYVHIAQDVRAELAEQAASGISAALTGKKSADVVPLKSESSR